MRDGEEGVPHPPSGEKKGVPPPIWFFPPLEFSFFSGSRLPSQGLRGQPRVSHVQVLGVGRQVPPDTQKPSVVHDEARYVHRPGIRFSLVATKVGGSCRIPHMGPVMGAGALPPAAQKGGRGGKT